MKITNPIQRSSEDRELHKVVKLRNEQAQKSFSQTLQDTMSFSRAAYDAINASTVKADATELKTAEPESVSADTAYSGMSDAEIMESIYKKYEEAYGRYFEITLNAAYGLTTREENLRKQEIFRQYENEALQAFGGNTERKTAAYAAMLGCTEDMTADEKFTIITNRYMSENEGRLSVNALLQMITDMGRAGAITPEERSNSFHEVFSNAVINFKQSAGDEIDDPSYWQEAFGSACSMDSLMDYLLSAVSDLDNYYSSADMRNTVLAFADKFRSVVEFQ